MKQIFFLLGICFPFLLAGQQEPSMPDPDALQESRNLTAEADEAMASDDFIQAEATYRRAIAKSEANPAAPYNLGNAYYESESYSEAFGRFKEAGDRASEKAEKHMAYHNMGNVYMQRKEYERAIEAYKEALRNNPADEETRYNLALAKELLEKDPQDQQNDQDQDDQQQQDQNEQQEQNQDQNEGGQDQQEDQEQNEQQGDSEKEDNKEGDGPEKQEQEQKPNPSEQEEQEQPPRPNQLSPQQIENLLEAMENEEKKVKEKIDAQKVKGPKVKKEKDW